MVRREGFDEDQPKQSRSNPAYVLGLTSKDSSGICTAVG